MSDPLAQVYALLSSTVLPRLKEIQASQADQRLHADRLERDIADFRAEMHLRFTELRAELAACRAQIEYALGTSRDSEEANGSEPAQPTHPKKTLLN
jgi:predicted phage gp36 major capsid-like protein